MSEKTLKKPRHTLETVRKTCEPYALMKGKNSETDILWERRGTVENQQATVITLAQLFAEASLDKIRTVKA